MRNYNIKEAYIYKFDLWLGILTAAALKIFAAENKLESYIMGQFVFGYDMILPIKNTVDWELYFQKKQTQIN